jgi:transcriptional regulator with XRE-family HTH domain
MAERRRKVGRRIKRARIALGYSSQQAFADALGIDKSSVANAESGHDRIAVRGNVYVAIEAKLGWPDDAISTYLESGDAAALSRLDSTPTVADDTAAELRRVEAEILRRLIAIRDEYGYDMFLPAARRIAELSREQYEAEKAARESGVDSA